MKLNLDFPEEKLITEQERRDYCTAIFAIFPRLEKDIKEEMYKQLITTYSESIGTSKTKETRDFETIRGNGIMEGMAILLEKWQVAKSEVENKEN